MNPEEHFEQYVRRIIYRENISRWPRRTVGKHLVAEPPEGRVEEDHDSRLAVRAALLRLTRSSGPCWCCASTRT